MSIKLQLRTSSNQSLAGVVAGVLDEVLDEAASQILSLGLPLGDISVGVTGIQNGGVNAGQLGGNLQIEQGDLLGGGVQDVTVWETKATDLAGRFIKNFVKYTGNDAGKALVEAGPKL